MATRIGSDSNSENGNGHLQAEALAMLLRLHLSSLTVQCPVCSREGLIMSKWIKGIKVKPVSVYHGSDGTAHQECQLSKEQAGPLRGQVRLSRPDLTRLFRNTDGYVLFSGGQDSLCTLLYLLEATKNGRERLSAIHVDTTAGFPEVTDYVRSICQLLDVTLHIVKPDRDYFDLAKRWGIPGFNARWCCHELKVKPIRDFLAALPDRKVVYDGIRAAESAQRSAYLPVWFHPSFRCLSVSPIIHWSHDEVRTYLEKHGLPESPAKAFGCSAECWCGAYKKRSDFQKLLEVHPDIFDKLVEVEKAQRGRFTFMYENGEQIRLESLKHTP